MKSFPQRVHTHVSALSNNAPCQTGCHKTAVETPITTIVVRPSAGVGAACAGKGVAAGAESIIAAGTEPCHPIITPFHFESIMGLQKHVKSYVIR